MKQFAVIDPDWLTSRSSSGETPISIAISRGDSELISVLLENDAVCKSIEKSMFVFIQNALKTTPEEDLMKGRTECLEKLLDKATPFQIKLAYQAVSSGRVTANLNSEGAAILKEAYNKQTETDTR